jgi:hypothetical protein
MLVNMAASLSVKLLRPLAEVAFAAAAVPEATFSDLLSPALMRVSAS